MTRWRVVLVGFDRPDFPGQGDGVRFTVAGLPGSFSGAVSTFDRWCRRHDAVASGVGDE